MKTYRKVKCAECGLRAGDHGTEKNRGAKVSHPFKISGVLRADQRADQ